MPHSARPACRLVLASASPRRRQILKEAGYIFEALDPGEAENAIAAAPGPEALAIAKARAKAQAVAARLPPPYPAITVGVDTLVALDETVVGKPVDRRDAVDILTRLSGTRHRVISGICLWPLLGVPGFRTAGILPAFGAGGTPAVRTSGTPLLAAESTWVRMRKINHAEIEAYVATGEADGKAGAYAVQETGDRFIESIEGSFSNVVGFPLELFQRLWLEAEQELRKKDKFTTETRRTE